MMYFLLIISISLIPLCLGVPIDQLIKSAARGRRATASLVRGKDTVVVEYDILFSQENWKMIQRENAGVTGRSKRNAHRDTRGRWTGGTIPYVIDQSFSSTDRAQVQAAINDYHSYTCLKFRPATLNDRNKVSLQNGDGCSSYVGMTGGRQEVELGQGCRTKGIIIHELGHVIGFHHEHTRPDRDQHVTIMSQNIDPTKLYNFQKYSSSIINTYDVPYDYHSIMHYGQYAFSNNGKRTIQTKDSSKQNVIGNVDGLSFRDIKLVNLMYKCDSQCTNKPTCPGEGFVGKDCKCKCPGNPLKDCEGTGGGTDCKDSHVNCAWWAGMGECERQSAIMLIYCKKSCRQCGDQTGSICKDDQIYCKFWARGGYCTDSYFKGYMETFCKKSCNLCGSYSAPIGSKEAAETNKLSQRPPLPTGAPASCKDKNAKCPSWAASGLCSKIPGFMLRQCKLSCDNCNRRKR